MSNPNANANANPNPTNCLLWKYDFDEESKSRKNFKNAFLHHGFSTNLVHKPEFLSFRFCLTSLKFLHSVRPVKDYSVLLGRHTIFEYFLVKSDLCSLRPFKLDSFENDAEYQNNH